jgi:hypothetical protein
MPAAGVEGATPVWSAVEGVAVGARDVTGVLLVLTPASTIVGRVTLDPSTSQLPPGTFTEVRATPVHGPLTEARAARTRADGTFEIAGVTPGRYVLSSQVLGQTAGASARSFASATLSGRDAADSPFDVSAGQQISDAVITFSNHPSEISGTLSDASGAPADQYFLIAFPTDRTSWTTWSRRVQQVRPGTDGHYRIVGLPPGEYALIGLTDVRPGDWRDVSLLEQLLPLAQVRLSLGDGERKLQDLRIAR